LRNGIDNVTFIVGKSEQVILDLRRDYIIPDAIILDPPRKGCDKKLLEMIVKLKTRKIVYVSCDPATLARDLAYLSQEGGYRITSAHPVDMFPRTAKIETVVVLKK